MRRFEFLVLSRWERARGGQRCFRTATALFGLCLRQTQCWSLSGPRQSTFTVTNDAAAGAPLVLRFVRAMTRVDILLQNQ